MSLANSSVFAEMHHSFPNHDNTQSYSSMGQVMSRVLYKTMLLIESEFNALALQPLT